MISMKVSYFLGGDTPSHESYIHSADKETSTGPHVL
jgi:hypothetical protein